MMMRRGFNYSYVTKRSDGAYELAGVAFTDAVAPARHLGHYLNERRIKALLAG